MTAHILMVNIFFTDTNPIAAAKDSCDSYVVKIPIEAALLLSVIHWRTWIDRGRHLGVRRGAVQDDQVRRTGNCKLANTTCVPRSNAAA